MNFKGHAIPDYAITPDACVDVNKLTWDQAFDLGFRKWSDELPIMLLPFWILDFLPEDVDLINIRGEKITKKSDIGHGVRGGVLGVGVLLKEDEAARSH